MGQKQHFVSKFLLRHFASDPKRRLISLYYIPGVRVIKGVSIRDQAYKKNLYGSDQNIEEYLTQIENRASVIISKILETETSTLTLDEDMFLKHFISLQINRTPEQIANLQTKVDEVTKIAFRHHPAVKDHLEDFTVEMTLPYHFMFGIAMDVTPMLFDLKVSLLQNASKEDILIGQHPAVVTNPILYLKQWPGSMQGVASKGALLLLPISPRHVLALYDRNRYGRTGYMSDSDVDKLNTLQFCYTTDCVYFGDTHNKGKLEEYRLKTQAFRENKKAIVRTVHARQERGKRSEIIMTTSEEPPVRPVFDFIDPKVIAMREKLGPTLDIARDEISDIAYRMFDEGSTPLPKRGEPSEAYYIESDED